MKIPKHIAIIMDGNGRWAEKRFLPKIAGHTKGVLAVERILKACTELGVKVLTLYTFSTENWKRSKSEVNALMGLLHNYLNKKAEELKKNGIKLMVSGDINGLPEKVVETIRHVEHLTRDNKELILNLALNYGARQEIVMAVKKIALLVKNNKVNIDDIDEDFFSDKLYSRSLPD
ncbi:MAG: polyprenyl diphosphate synthase, partial [Candidatus Omnitrophica bacterium]|nr:polyprenyl diphosphate synthase [Candidatus Omnitrophota bacterium]